MEKNPRAGEAHPSSGPGKKVPSPVPFSQALRYWVTLGFINFGGPAGQIAMMHRDLVDRRRWIPEGEFLRGLNFCMLLPGPEAQQLATYVGWRLHGVWGGVAAGLWFILPSVVFMLALSWLVAAYGEVPLVAGLLYGVQPIVIAIVAEAVARIGRRTLRHWGLALFAAGAFVAIYFFRLPFPAIIALAAASGAVLARRWPHVFLGGGEHAASDAAGSEASSPTSVAFPPLSRAVKVLALFFALWLVPVGLLALWQGGRGVLVQEALFFTGAAFVTFGGAYAVLSYVAEAAVHAYGWLEPAQMIQGLALAESTPGPLIMVLQFVGFLAAWRFPGELPPLLSGTLGALTVTYVTFLPCFMFILAGAPYIEALAANRRLQASLVGVTSAVVGVILNLAVFFATQVLLPKSGGVDFFALALTLAAFLALSRLRWQIYTVVGLGAAGGVAWTWGRAALGL